MIILNGCIHCCSVKLMFTISREINWPRQYEQLRTSIGAKKQHFGAKKLHSGLIWAKMAIILPTGQW